MVLIDDLIGAGIGLYLIKKSSDLVEGKDPYPSYESIKKKFKEEFKW